MRHSPKVLLAKILIRIGITADMLTFAGLFFSFYAAWLVLHDSLQAAGAALLFSGLLDLLDGAVARESGKAGPFGGILDSTLDRYGDGAVLGGILFYCAGLDQVRYMVLALSALIGSFSISYVRARAECEVDDCRTGFWERGERLTLLALALLFNNLPAALWILGIATHWTVFQRLAFSRLRTKGSSDIKIPSYLRSSPRNAWPYFLKVALLVLCVLFWRPA